MKNPTFASLFRYGIVPICFGMGVGFGAELLFEPITERLLAGFGICTAALLLLYAGICWLISRTLRTLAERDIKIQGERSRS